MRFRTAEDEKVYNALRVEIFLRLGAHLPPLVMNEVLRNFGKIEALLYSEGLRQGMASAKMMYDIVLDLDDEKYDADQDPCVMPALVAHALFYQGAATPLARVEAAHLQRSYGEDPEKLAKVRAEAWYDASPLPFAPQTLAEAQKLYGPELEPAAPSGAKPAWLGRYDELAEKERRHRTKAAKELREEISDRDADDETSDPATDAHLESRDASPAFLDRVRDELKHMLDGGWKPTNWQELILGLHHRMQIDAFALDVQLSGDLGRAVLAQVGLPAIAPGMGVAMGADGGIKFVSNLDELMRGG